MGRDLFVLLLIVSILRLVDYLRLIQNSESVMLLDDMGLLLSEFSVIYIVINLFSIYYA